MTRTPTSKCDIISVSLLAKELMVCLDDTSASPTENQAIKRELLFLDQALLKVEQLSQRYAPCPELHALYEASRETVEQCQSAIKDFREKIAKYSLPCQDFRGTTNCFRGAAAAWKERLCQKSLDVAKFRVALTGHTESLNILLATARPRLARSDEETDASENESEAAPSHRPKSRHVQDNLTRNCKEICQGSSLRRRLCDRARWIGNLCCGLKRMMCGIITENCEVYQKCLSWKHPLACRGLPFATEEPFFFEDACGGVVPVSLCLVDSWDVFQIIIEHRFQGRPGLGKIRRKEYHLHEEATGRMIQSSGDIRRDILPGSRVVQEMVFHEYAAQPSSDNRSTCPCCHQVSSAAGDGPVKCSNCSRFFRREHETVSSELTQNNMYEGPADDVQELKRKRDCEPSRRCSVTDADLYMHFRRICVVIRCLNIASETPGPVLDDRTLSTNEAELENECPDSHVSTLESADSASFPSDQQFALPSSQTFDFVLFGDYREIQDNIMGLDDANSFFDDAFHADFVTPYQIPPPPALHGSHWSQIDTARESKGQAGKLLNSKSIWEKLQDSPRVQTGDFDLDALCSDLQKKARCSGSGAVVVEDDFASIMKKHLGN